MTREEAIKILDPETSRDALWKYEDKEERLEAVNEACRVAVAALRAQQTSAKLDRSRWEGCNYCNKYGFGNIRPDFCYRCGKPQNEKAWAELEQRIGGNGYETDI